MMGPNADCSFSPLTVLCTCPFVESSKNKKQTQNKTFNHSLQLQRFKAFRSALVVSILLVCTEAQLNCKLVPVAGLATECLFTQMMTLSVFLQPFEREFIALFMSRALIMGDGCDRFPLHICFFDSTGV